jgi:hypothetical protein
METSPRHYDAGGEWAKPPRILYCSTTVNTDRRLQSLYNWYEHRNESQIPFSERKYCELNRKFGTKIGKAKAERVRTSQLASQSVCGATERFLTFHD